MRNSLNTDPMFITTRPDWAGKVALELLFATSLYTSRAGKEQRTRQRFTGKPRISYKQSGLSKADWDARLPIIRLEMRSVCIVPFWTEGLPGHKSERPVGRRCGPSARRLAAPVAMRRRCGLYVYEMDAPTREEWFTAGDWVYLWDGEQGQFRQLVRAVEELPGRRRASWFQMRECAEFRHRAVRPGAHLILLRPPANGAASLGDEVVIYPCKSCRRISAQDEGRRRSQHSFEEKMIYEAL